ncbi:hypothetical protein ACTXT7_001086 [Hymenolepis weldensis]
MTSEVHRRDKRSPYTPAVLSELESSLGQSMLLECAGCALQLPTSPMAPNSAVRWLVMAKKLNKTRANLTYSAPSLQIISIMSWQKDDANFRDALRDIRTIPKAILCNPNTKVELNLDGFHRGEPTTPQPAPARPAVRTSWSRQGWMAQERLATLPRKFPANFESLFQNDAASGNRKSRKHRKHQMQKQKQGQKQSAEPVKVAKIQPKIEDDKERKRQRRKARKEKLAKMTHQQREAWKARRQTRRAQRQKLRGRQVGQRKNSDQLASRYDLDRVKVSITRTNIQLLLTCQMDEVIRRRKSEYSRRPNGHLSLEELTSRMVKGCGGDLQLGSRIADFF